MAAQRRLTRPLLPPLADVHALLAEIWDSGTLANGGPMEARFQAAIEQKLGWRDASMVSSCTAGLQLLLRVHDLAGEVLVPALSHPATFQAVQWNGLTPVPVDVHPETLTVDTTLLARSVTSRTSAILAVHLFGHPADVLGLERFAASAGLVLLFDAASAMGVRLGGVPIVEYGHGSSVSLHATKILGVGEGGVVSVTDRAIRDKLRRLRNFGLSDDSPPLERGTNAKLSEVASAIGLAALPHLGPEIRAREMALRRYRELLAGRPGVRFVEARPDSTPNFSYAALRLRTADGAPAAQRVHALLEAQSIESRRYFGGNYRTRLTSVHPTPVADAAAADLLCVPLWGGMPESLIDEVCDVIGRDLP